MSDATTNEIQAAFEDHDRQIAIGRIRIGCYLGMSMLPAGSLVDLVMYPNEASELFLIRLGGSVAMLPLLLLVNTVWGSKNYKTLGVLLAMIPAAVMTIILKVEEVGTTSPYYAGLNLVMLAIGLVLQWNFAQSFIAAFLVISMYMAVYAINPSSSAPTNRDANNSVTNVIVVSTNTVSPPAKSDLSAKSDPPAPTDLSHIFITNVWFLGLTGIIVVVGNFLQSRLRFAEFALRYKLDASQKELERSNKRLRELDELKGRFFANISHELRTPLTLLLAPLEALRLQAGVSADMRLRENMDTMYANGLRLLKLINDLLDLVRLETGKLRLRIESMDVTDFLRGIVNLVKRIAEDKNLTLKLDIAEDVESIKADNDKLEKVFLNLLFNSVKFTPAGETISVNVTRDQDHILFQVVDTGVGINPDHLPYIFDRFWQADDAANRKFQGTGIGLALVKELVEAHQGTVTAQSQPGAGTTMTVRLPIVTSSSVQAIADSTVLPKDSLSLTETTSTLSPVSDKNWLAGLHRRAEMFPGFTPLRDTLRPFAAPGNGNRPRLLIADDEYDMLRFLQSQLGDHYEIITASDGDQAISLVTQYLPGVVLCDMMLPEKDGLEVCRSLRANPPTRDIPIMILTARADDETKLQCLAAGANDFLTKPFSTAEVRVRLKNLVDNNQLQKALSWQNKKLASTVEQLKETELQLVQSEKMAALGRMSAGIIHEINNPINFAKTGLFTLERKSKLLPEGERADYEEIIHDIEEGITRVATIVADMRAFTHPQGGSEEDVDVQKCLIAALRFLAAETKGNIQVTQEIPEGFTVRGNRNKLLQVFVNLLQNSIDALRYRSQSDTPTIIRVTTAASEGFQRIFFWDNGPGISDENLRKIFDPFFTTKDVGQGTGLGLSICYRILADANGRITVRSEVDQFTEFCLEFPTID